MGWSRIIVLNIKKRALLEEKDRGQYFFRSKVRKKQLLRGVRYLSEFSRDT